MSECVGMVEGCGQGAIHGSAHTLAVKAGVNFAKPDMMIAVVAVAICTCMSGYVVDGGKVGGGEQSSWLGLYTSFCICNWR